VGDIIANGVQKNISQNEFHREIKEKRRGEPHLCHLSLQAKSINKV